MTREQLISILQESGWDNSSKLAINSILNVVNEEKKTAIEAAKAEVREEFKEFKSKEEYQKLELEITNLKDAGAKAERLGKLKEKGIQEKYIDFADGVLKDSKNFEKDLEKYLKDYPEQFKISNPKNEDSKVHSFQNMGDGEKPNSKDTRDADWTSSFLDALNN